MHTQYVYDESSMCGMCVYIYSLFFNIFINRNLFSLLFYNLLCIAFKWKIVKYFLTIINCTTSFNIYCGSYTTLTLEKCNIHIIFTTNLRWYVIGFNVDSPTSNNMLPNFANWLGWTSTGVKHCEKATDYLWNFANWLGGLLRLGFVSMGPYKPCSCGKDFWDSGFC